MTESGKRRPFRLVRQRTDDNLLAPERSREAMRRKPLRGPRIVAQGCGQGENAVTLAAVHRGWR
jgi:hypothetical protein